MINLRTAVLACLALAVPGLGATFEKSAGTFTLRTTTGTQSITSLSFQPKIIFFSWNEQTTANTYAASYSLGYGVAVSSSSRAAVFVRQNDGGLNADARHASDRCIAVVNASGAISHAADFVSMNSNGFTINVTNASTAVRVSYEAWGGPALTNVSLVQFTTPTTTGSQQITGAGFAPDLVQFFTIGHTAAPPNTTTGGRLGFGFAANSSTGITQAGLGNSVLTASTNDTGSQSTTKALYVPNTTAMYLEADVTSFDSNGVTLNFTTVPSSATYAWAVFTKGLQATVGSFLQPTSTGDRPVTLPFQPETTIFASYCHAATTGQQATGKLSLGFGVSDTEQFVNWSGANTGNNQAQQANFSNAVLACYTPSGLATPVLNSKAAFVSNDSTGFTLNFSTVDSTRRQIIYVSVAPAATTEVIAPLLISTSHLPVRNQ